MHIKKVLDNGRRIVDQLHKFKGNKNINLSVRRLLLSSVMKLNIQNRKYW